MRRIGICFVAISVCKLRTLMPRILAESHKLKSRIRRSTADEFFSVVRSSKN